MIYTQALFMLQAHKRRDTHHWLMKYRKATVWSVDIWKCYRQKKKSIYFFNLNKWNLSLENLESQTSRPYTHKSLYIFGTRNRTWARQLQHSPDLMFISIIIIIIINNSSNNKKVRCVFRAEVWHNERLEFINTSEIGIHPVNIIFRRFLSTDNTPPVKLV